MKKYSQLMLILLTVGVVSMMQSCLKEKGLFDSEMTVDIDPSYGAPLANLDISGEDIAGVINQRASSFRIEFDPTDNKIAVVVWDNDGVNIPIPIPPGTSGTTPLLSGSYPLDFLSDFRKIPGLMPMIAYLDFYVDNDLNESIQVVIDSLYFTSGGMAYPIKDFSTPSDIISVPSGAVYDSCYRIVINMSTLAKLLIMDAVTIHYAIQAGVGSTVTGGDVTVYPVLRMPVWMELRDWVRHDTTKMDMGSIEQFFSDSNSIYVKDADLYIYGINAIPTNELVQLYFTDENYRILDSLHTDVAPSELVNIAAATPSFSTSYFYIPKGNETKFTSTVKLTGERLKKLRNARFVIIKQIYSSYQNRDIKLYINNYLHLNVAMKVNMKVSGEIMDLNINQ